MSTPGSYAFLSDPDDTSTVVTTYEALRDGTTTALLIHTSDADGLSRADGYDAVEVGDLFEWRQADDCWVRYTVTSLPTAVSGTATREFEVKAFTDSYAGCNGTIVADGVRSIGWAPPAISSRALTSPVRHGLYHLIPAGWLGPVADSAIAPVPDHVAAIRDYRGGTHPFWRPANVPEGWSLAGVTWGNETDPTYGYSAWYQNEHGEVGVEILVGYWAGEQYPYPLPVFRDTGWEREPRIIDGHHAIVEYSPLGPKHQPRFLPRVELFNAETRMFYLVIAWDPRLAGDDPTATIEIAESLFEDIPPGPGATTTFRYDTYDTTGAVSTPGSYAFLSDLDDTSTVVTTYEGLRDGTTTALLIHTSDADGASRADAYDAVEAGDTFEWRHVDDCWVRYIVEDVKPDPTGTAPRKLLALRWVTYTYSGCTGAIPSAGDRFMSWTPPAVQRPESGRMPAPVRHGPWLVMPLGWTGELQEVRYLGQRDPVEPSQVLHTTDIDEARREIPLWREPSGIPGTWTLGEVLVGGEVGPWSGFEASWESPKGRVIIIVVHSRWRKDHLRGVGTGAVMEMRRIGGHPAIVQYWPPEDKDSGTRVFLYDESTGIEVFVAAYSLELGETVAVALSLVDAHDPPTTSQPPVPATATPSPTPVAPGATTFRYNAYDTTGAVSTAGSYAFLSDPDDTSTVVTTYEALRDGTTTALLIHTSDAGGASRADVYDAVEAGDLFEWHQADDCFVRYTVTEVTPDPAGDVPKPESTDRSLTGRDAGLPESSAACRRSPGGAGGGPERGAVAQRGSAALRARARGCAGMLARASEPGRRCERASGRER